MPQAGDIDYSQVVELDLGQVVPSLAGPKRPQDRIAITDVASRFAALFIAPAAENGFNQPPEKLGGTFDAGPRPGGGWTVAATLPRRPVTT